MYQLYWAKNTGAFVVHSALELANLDYEICVIDYENKEHQSPQYKRINPMGQLPVLVLPDDAAISESVAILLHLNDQHPNSNLLPNALSTRAIGYKWLLFMATNTYNEDLRYYYADRFTDDPDQSKGVKNRALEQMNDSFSLMNTALSNSSFMLGAQMCIVDVYLTMLCMWHPNQTDLFKANENLHLVFQSVKNHSIIASIWSQNFPDELEV